MRRFASVRRETLGDMTQFDRSDARLLLALCDTPRATGVQLAAALQMARNTVQSRLARWEERRVLSPMDRLISTRDLGYTLRAYISAVVDQHRLEPIIALLGDIPEVIEVIGISGDADLLVAVAAVDADDLYRVAGLVLAVPGIERTTMSVAMRDAIPYRTRPLLERLARGR